MAFFYGSQKAPKGCFKNDLIQLLLEMCILLYCCNFIAILLLLTYSFTHFKV